jgi:hypothetical protein
LDDRRLRRLSGLRANSARICVMLLAEYGLVIRELMRVPRTRPRSSAGVGTGGHDLLDA